VWVYTAREERQEWRVPGFGAGADGSGDDGGSLWLPGGCVVTFRMVAAPQPAGGASGGGEDEGGSYHHSAASNGSGGGGGAGGGNGRAAKAAAAGAPPLARGVVMSFAWLTGEGAGLVVERAYDAAGRLLEVRHASAVKGGWSGGRM
jgi:hypothetical protein